jgi:hypothetical protein
MEGSSFFECLDRDVRQDVAEFVQYFEETTVEHCRAFQIFI